MLLSHPKPFIAAPVRFLAVSMLMFVFSTFTFACKGGGDKKKHRDTPGMFSPIDAASSFTLKKAPLYSGSVITIRPQTDNRISINAMVTYQRGNTTVILPYQYKLSFAPASQSSRNNLQFLGVKIQMLK